MVILFAKIINEQPPPPQQQQQQNINIGEKKTFFSTIRLLCDCYKLTYS